MTTPASPASPAAPASADLARQMLAALTTRRAHEAELAALPPAETEESRAAQAEALQQLQRGYAEALRQLQLTIEQEREATTQAAGQRRIQWEAGIAERLRTLQETRDRQTATLEGQLHDRVWLATSITDVDGEHGPQTQFERLRQQVEQASSQLTQLAEEAQRGQQQLAATLSSRRSSLEELPAPGRIPTTREELAPYAQGQLELFQLAATEVEQLLIPKALVGWRPLWISCMLWVAATGLIWAMVDPRWFLNPVPDQSTWLAICGAAGLAFTLLSGFAIWISAGQVTAGPVETAGQALADGRAALARWQKLSTAELQQAEAEATREQQALQERQSRQQARLRRDHATALQAVQESFTRQASALEQEATRERERLTRELSAARQELDSRSQNQQARLDADLQLQTNRLRQRDRAEQADRQQARAAAQSRLDSDWGVATAAITRRLTELEERSRRLSPDWHQVLSTGWLPPREPGEGDFRLGRFHPLAMSVQDQSGILLEESPSPSSQGSLQSHSPLTFPPEWEWPAEWSYPGRSTLWLKGTGAGLTAAIALLQTAMLRWLTQLPAGTVRLTICDPVGLGENFAAFMNLADYDELLITHRIWTEPGQIEEQLSQLTAHMETIFQKYLRNEFDSIVEYNRQAGEVAEPYRLLVIAGFPASFTEESLQRLRSIVAKGGRCGVATLLAHDTATPCPTGFPLEELEQQSLVLTWREDRFVHQPATTAEESPTLALHPDAPPPPSTLVPLVRRLGALAQELRRVEVSFQRVAPAATQMWQADSRSGLTVPLGRAGATRLQSLQLGRGTSQHVLVAGKTGSGKSTLLHVIVTNLALRYAPEQLEFYLVDFKKGVEFKTYATHRLPHARTIAVESDREFGVSVLERLDAVLRERGDLFRSVGAQDLAGCRAALPHQPLPRVLLVVDEFQEFFVEDDRHSQQAALLLDRLVRQGRAFGIHVLLGSQSLGGAYTLPRTTLGQMAIRIALQCSEADAHLILSETNSAARLLTRPGEAIYNDTNGLPDGNSPFQIAWLNDEERDQQLQIVSQLAHRSGHSYPDPVVFEGNKPSDPRTNADLVELLHSAAGRAAHGSPPAVAAPHPPDPPKPLVGWLGESIALAGSTALTLERRAGAHLLLVGPSPAPARGLLANLTLAWLAQPGVQVDVLSLDRALDRALDRPLAAGPGTSPKGESPALLWRDMVHRFPGQLRVTLPGDLPACLSQLHAELLHRQTVGGASQPARVVVIEDLAQFRDLRKGDDDFGFGGDRSAELSPAKQFAALLKEGPTWGLHVATWCDTPGNLERWLGRSLLRELESRVLFALSAGDSSNLCDSPAAARLGPNRALLYSDLRGSLEKFRPYAPPDPAWLVWAAAELQLPTTSPQSAQTADVSDQRGASSTATERPPATAAPIAEGNSPPTPPDSAQSTISGDDGENVSRQGGAATRPPTPTRSPATPGPEDDSLPDIADFRIS